ncbi:MAG: pentapeptide repeat-containing protein [Acaryochloridaceae cyanobacterium SU_2_1]|nr:pentapeptide repeat-containing protein [Acaryochloridaceae cyanobacterium SU_2_1]
MLKNFAYEGKSLVIKFVHVTTATILSLTAWVLPAHAEDPDPLKQLLTTGACQGCNLSNADLSDTDLSKANLSQANLSNANLSQANLSQANLKGARLYLANFRDANLTGADLSQANLTGAKLDRADLSSAKLVDANFTYAHLPAANLKGANLKGANFSDSDLSHAQLINTQIADSNLNHANLEGTGLEQEKDSQSQRVIKPVMAESSGTEPLTTDLDLQSAPLPKTILANQNSLVLPEQREPFVESNQPEIESSQLTADNNITEPNSITEPNNSGEPSSSDEPNNDKPNNSVEPEKTEFTAEESPIANRQFQAPTAKHLRQGELVLDGRQRFFFTSNSTSADGTPFFISAGARFGVTNNLELALAIQAVDSGSFDPLDFDSSVVSPNNYDIALELKQRIWKNSSNTQALSGVVSASGLRRKFVFSRNGTTSEVDGDGIVPALQLPFTIAVGNRLDLTVAPTVAFFKRIVLFLYLARPLPILAPLAQLWG